MSTAATQRYLVAVSGGTGAGAAVSQVRAVAGVVAAEAVTSVAAARDSVETVVVARATVAGAEALEAAAWVRSITPLGASEVPASVYASLAAGPAVLH